MVTTQFGPFRLSGVSVTVKGPEGRGCIYGTDCLVNATGKVTNSTSRNWRRAAFRVSLFDKKGGSIACNVTDMVLEAELVSGNQGELGFGKHCTIYVGSLGEGQTADLPPGGLGIAQRKFAAFRIAFEPESSTYEVRYQIELIKPVGTAGLSYDD